jgi:anti-sigma regulatory factor (Ser/Thr protein kinase)
MRELDRTSLGLPPTARSTTLARRFVLDALSTWGFSDLADTAALLTSEVVTNAVLHARTDLRIDVVRLRDGVTVEVSDGSRRGLIRRRQSREATTGRGLELLERLASAWSVVPSGGGKTVRFTLLAGDDPWEGVGEDWLEELQS